MKNLDITAIIKTLKTWLSIDTDSIIRGFKSLLPSIYQENQGLATK